MSRCVSLRVFSSQNSYTTSQSETPSATQAIERQRWREQVFHHFKRAEPSNKLLSLSQHSEVEHSYFSKEVVSLNSLYPFLTFYPPIFLSLTVSLSLPPVAAYYFFVEEYVIARIAWWLSLMKLLVSAERQSDSDSPLLISLPLSSLCPFALSLSLSLSLSLFFCNPSTNCCSV